ncbi:nucleophile aminohydrolase [Gigaspora rosea]|uniref:Nucleophile aminohydrolase n=1 Tax=Gigaspora rosea TaxID=44941 RepID=A0A397UB45_9GLOM|nr:nucleophile aminohydrolase [Gigaspora rosea]
MLFKYQSISYYDKNNVNRRFLKRIILTIIIVICVFTLLTLWKQPKDPENALCSLKISRIGIDVLKEGGSAVDAAIATELGVTINAFSAGIGGGGLMLIHLPNGTSEFIDSRETAPHIANKGMFVKSPNSASIGGFSVGVPFFIYNNINIYGEINGMKIAHERHGKLPWKRLFEPSIKLSRDGFPVGLELDIRLKRSTHPRVLLEIVYRRNFSRSLELISENYTEFYEGNIARSLIKEINGRGGIMSCDDFKNYKTIIREPVIGYYHGKKISNNGLDITNLHRYLFIRIELGDPEYFRDQFAHETRIQEIISKEYATLVRANDSDVSSKIKIKHSIRTIYNPIFDHKDDHGKLNMGSRVLDPVTGILLNDEMDDFSIPGVPNHFGLWPSPYNFVSPGKRPLPLTVPTIVENENGKVELLTGGSGGSKILSVVLQVFFYALLDAINSPRVHHQLLPNSLGIEQGLNYELVDKLLTIGHVIQLHNIENRVHSYGTIHAVSDFRKSGVAAVY